MTKVIVYDQLPGTGKSTRMIDKPWHHRINMKETTKEEENQILKVKNTIESHNNSIRKWEAMIEKAKDAIKYNESRILDIQGLSYYVYIVFVEGVAMYVGKGKGERYKHPVSGASSCVELNKDNFAGKYIEVMFAEKGLTEKSALKMEQDWIYQINQYADDYKIYNRKIPDTADYKDECMEYFYHHWFQHAIDNAHLEGVVINRPKFKDSSWALRYADEEL